jgi:indole-3-glycerol phosphate synthase
LLRGADAVDLAATYEQAGASAVSVLTDERYFKGTLDDFVAVRQNVALPCLRKDFVIDEYQIYESRVANSDALLLIVRVLSEQQLEDYLALARELGMAALVEAHSAEEIARALHAGAHIIGINNRDLSTFEVNLSLTLELRKHVPGGHVLVSESGIETRDHVKRLEDGGVDAILVGETLVRSENIVAKVHELLAIEKR